ncbi:MAG: phage portal protein, partial [Smithella sp.]
MNLLNRFKRAIGYLKALGLNDPKAWSSSIWNLAGTSVAGETVTEETALTNSAVYNAVSLISGTIGALPLHLMQKKGDKKRIADERTVYSVLHDSPNPFMTAMAFREAIMAHVLLWGNGYAEIVRNGYGEVVELWPITPNRVSIGMESGKVYYTINMGNQPDVILPREKVLHIPGRGFDGFQGYSVVAMARKSFG